MATRLYLSSSVAADVAPDYDADWEYITFVTRRKMAIDKSSSSFATWSRTVTASGLAYKILRAQFVSDPMSSGIAFTSGQTIKGQIRAREAASDDDLSRAIKVRIVSEDGLTVRHSFTLGYSAYTEFPQPTLTNRAFPASATLGSDYTTLAGDRLVIEVGWFAYDRSGLSVCGYISIGDSSDTDLPVDETTVEVYNPWVEFSTDITFGAYTGDGAAVVAFTGAATATTGEVYSTPTELGDQEMITCLAYGDHFLIQVGAGGGLGTTAGDVIVSLDGDTFVKDSGGADADIIWSLPYGNFLGPATAPWGGEMIPYFFTEAELFALDFWSRKAYPMPTGLQSIKCGCFWSESIILSDGYNVIQLIPGDPTVTRPLGLRKEQGFLTGTNYRVESLKGVTGGSLHALLSDGTNTWLWEYTGAAWHPLGKPVGHPYGIGLIVTDVSLGATGIVQPRRTYWSVSSDLATYPNEQVAAYRISDPAGDPNPLIGTSTFEIGQFYAETPWLDGGFRDLDGAALQMWFGGTVPTDTLVSVYYRLDDSSGAFTLLGQFDGTNDHINFGASDASGKYPGIQFRTIQFRFMLETSDSSASPNALAMTFVFRKKPSLRMSYLVNIDATREFRENSKDIYDLVTELSTAWNTKTLIRFYYPVREESDELVADGSREVDARVDIVSMPTRETEIRQAVRRGLITVQVMEPASW